jgi:hypothetical protein
LCVATTTATAVLAGAAAALALAGLLTRISWLLTAAVVLGVIEELAAVLSSGAQADLGVALLLGVAVYLLLDISAFGIDFSGVSVDSSVYRMKLVHWGWTALLSALTGLILGLAAAACARPWNRPLPLYLLTVAGACMSIGAITAAVRLWRAGSR